MQAVISKVLIIISFLLFLETDSVIKSAMHSQKIYQEQVKGLAESKYPFLYCSHT